MDSAEWESLRAKANQVSNDQFAKEASGIVALTKQQVSDIITESGSDKADLAELMKVVSDATASNEQKAQAVRNINKFAEMAVALIDKLA